jgi:hypothetical protein
MVQDFVLQGRLPTDKQGLDGFSRSSLRQAEEDVASEMSSAGK